MSILGMWHLSYGGRGVKQVKPPDVCLSIGG